jgi:periplasmic protein TonB
MTRAIAFRCLVLLLFTLDAASVRASEVSPGALAAYKHQIVLRVFKNRLYPRHAPSGTTTIAFSLDKDGKLISESIAIHSGSDLLDAAAFKSIKRSFPFPPPPGFQGAHFTIPISFHGDEQQSLVRRIKRQ